MLGAVAGCLCAGMLAVSVVACGSPEKAAAPHRSASPSDLTTRLHHRPGMSPYSTALDATTINGSVPPGRLLPLQNLTTTLDTIDAYGNRLVVTRGTRMPGTRVAVHMHKYGGHTCVLSGEITDFVEGREPTVWPAGTCYYMPPNTLMSAANLGTEEAVLIDTFSVPLGQPLITIREPGWPAG